MVVLPLSDGPPTIKNGTADLIEYLVKLVPYSLSPWKTGPGSIATLGAIFHVDSKSLTTNAGQDWPNRDAKLESRDLVNGVPLSMTENTKIPNETRLPLTLHLCAIHQV